MTAHIAEVARSRAKAAINAKLQVLNRWAAAEIPWLKDSSGAFLFDQDGERQLDFFPRDVFAFTGWNGTQNCASTRLALPVLSTTNRSTLDKPYHQALKVNVESALTAIVAKAALQVTSSHKTGEILHLKAERDFLDALAQRQEIEILQLRERHLSGEIELRLRDRALRENLAEHQRIVADFETKISGLTRLLAKITPLRSKVKK